MIAKDLNTTRSIRQSPVCGAIVKAVTSDTRGPYLKSRHCQSFGGGDVAVVSDICILL